MHAMHRPGKLGIGSAHQEGIRYAYAHGYETLVTMDCDFTHQPADVEHLLEVSRASGTVRVHWIALPGRATACPAGTFFAGPSLISAIS